MRKWHAFVLLTLLILGGVWVAYRVFNKAHRSVAEETGLAVEAGSLFNAFEVNEAAANTLYLNKVVIVHGKISEISKNQEGKMIILLSTDSPMFGVNCTLQQKADYLTAGQEVKVKGICTGYLSDVIVVDGIIEK